MGGNKPSGYRAHDTVAAFNEAIEMAAVLVEKGDKEFFYRWYTGSWRRKVKQACQAQRCQLAANVRRLKREPAS